LVSRTYGTHSGFSQKIDCRMDVKMKRITVTFTVKGELEIVGWEGLTKDEQQQVVERLQSLLTLAQVVDENAQDW
jgi:hypothetical protein